MKSVAAFLEHCVQVSSPLPVLDVSLENASGCILAQDIYARFDLPQRHLADGDGYAVRACEVAAASREHPVVLPVIASVPVTAQSAGTLIPGSSMLVASGSPLPAGADAVVTAKSTDRGTAKVSVFSAVEEGANVRCPAEDTARDSLLLAAGIRLGARQIALLAAQGYSAVPVHPAPRVVILTVGDELQTPGRPLQSGQVYDAVSHALASAVRDAGGHVFRVGVVSDDKASIRETLEDQLVRADIIITIGGLSYGGGDYVKEVLSECGAVRFDAVAMWPGRQYGVGMLSDEATVFCLPGNPTAALTAFEVFIRPALRTMAGYVHVHRQPIQARLTSAWGGRAGLEEYVPVRVLGNPSDGYNAEVLCTLGKTSLSSLAHANALAVIPQGVDWVDSGEMASCIVIDR